MGITNRHIRPQYENDYFTEICSGSEAGSNLRLIDFFYHSTLGVRVIKKKKKKSDRCRAVELGDLRAVKEMEGGRAGERK